MAVTVNAAMPSGTEGGVNLTTLTIAAGANRALVAFLFGHGTDATPTMTWGGVALTKMGTVANATSGRSVVVFGLVNPATGTGPLVTTTAFGEIIVYALAFDGADQTGGATTFANFNSATGNSTSPSVAITTAAGNATASGMTAPVGSWTPNQANLFFLSGAGDIDGGAQRASDASGSTTHSATISSAQWATAGVAIVAAGGGGGRASKNIRPWPLGMASGMHIGEPGFSG